MSNDAVWQPTTDQPDSRLLWLDVETTGLSATHDHLLQVAATVTDIEGNQLSDEFERVVLHSRAVRSRASEFVQNMHDATGLWDRLPDGVPVDQIDDELFEFVREYAPNRRQARLAGNSVRLDANFGDANLPRTMEHIHYRLVDVSGLAFLASQWGLAPGVFTKAKTHNAVDDIRESLAEYRALRSVLVDSPRRRA